MSAVPRGTRRAAALAAAVCAVVSVLAYLPVRHSGFVQDDHPIVRQNPIVERGDPIEILTTDYWAGVAGNDDDLYRPVTIGSFAIERAIVGRVDAGPGHAVNVLLHALASWLLALWLLRLGARPAAAIAAAALFAAHPIHVGAVAGLVGRAELLAAVFGLAALVLDLPHRGRDATPRSELARRLAVAVCVLLALGSKESAVAVPVLLVVQAAFVAPAERPGFRGAARAVATRARTWVPTVAAGLVWLALRTQATGGLLSTQSAPLSDNPLVGLDGWTRAFTALAVAGRYLELLVYPARLSADYSGNVVRVETSPLAPYPLLGLVFLAAVASLAIRGLLRRGAGPRPGERPASASLAGLAASAFALPYLVVGNLLVLVGVAMAERLMYWPSIGFCALVGLGIGAVTGLLPASARARTALACVAIAVPTGVLAARAYEEAGHWKDEETLFTAVLAAHPDNPRAHFTIGKIRLDQGRSDEAFAAFERTVELWPQFSAAWFELGNLHVARGEIETARDAYARAVEINPYHAAAAYNHALALARLGSLEHAEARLVDVLERFPAMVDAAVELANVRFRMGRYEQAAALYEQAAERGRPDVLERAREARRRAERRPP